MCNDGSWKERDSASTQHVQDLGVGILLATLPLMQSEAQVHASFQHGFFVCAGIWPRLHALQS